MRLDDADEDREGRDAEAETDKQHEREPRGAGDAELPAERKGQEDAQGERQEHARVAGRQDEAAVRAQETGVEMKAHEEHEQHETKLAERVQEVEARGREQESRSDWRDRAEERRAEQQPCHHLADDGRLAETAEGGAEAAGRGDDDDRLEQ